MNTEIKGMRVKFNKTFKKEKYLFHLRVQVNSYEAKLNRVCFEESISCTISQDFSEIIIPEGIELRGFNNWVEKKVFRKLKIPKTEQSKIKEYISGL